MDETVREVRGTEGKKGRKKEIREGAGMGEMGGREGWKEKMV